MKSKKIFELIEKHDIKVAPNLVSHPEGKKLWWAGKVTKSHDGNTNVVLMENMGPSANSPAEAIEALVKKLGLE